MEVSAVLLPSKFDTSMFASLTESRQKILIDLVHENELTFTRLLEKSKVQSSSLSETLTFMQDKALLTKTENNTYKLTTNGKLLGLMLMRPNGRSEADITKALDNLLEENFDIEEKDIRDAMIDTLREDGKVLSNKKT